MKETKEISLIGKKEIFANQKYFEAVLPKNFDVNKFMATLSLEVQKNPKLGQCINLIEVAKDVASFGLIIGGLANQSYLIPFNKKIKDGNNWKSIMTAQLIIGYRGYIAKLEEAGYTVEAEIVTNDEVEKGLFKELRGSETRIMHSPIRNGIRTREDIALAYCVIKHKDNPPVISVLSKEEIEEMAKKEQYIEGKKVKALGNVWQSKERSTDYGQMCIKTAIRNAVKKVNLQIANEMSTYEGKRDENIIVEKQEPKIINDLPPVNFEDDGDIVYTPEQLKEIEEAEKKAEIERKAQELKLAKEGE
jgi:phage RecT family recombinase